MEWRNWSGSLRFKPERIAQPRNEQELAAIVSKAIEQGRTVRPVGAGHSSTPILKTSGALVDLCHFNGLVSHDESQATLGAP
jgi:FAD/FMN-containing dehydrogenase